MKIATVIGARPQFIKAAPLSRAIAEHNRTNPGAAINEILVHTGQHYDDAMSAVFFRELEIPEPVYHLSIGSGLHGEQTGRMLAEIEKVLLDEKPDWVLVYGDTNSTLAGALVAAKLHIPIAHVEAGLRSFNRRMPEEINRVVADHLSRLLLCPSETARANLQAEGITQGVELVGDVMADAVLFAKEKTSQSSILKDLELDPKRYLLATVHRAENTDDANRLTNILSAFSQIDETIIFPVHPRTRKCLESACYQPPSNLKLLEPVGYFEMIALEQSACMILTDSGGMQKEAYWLEVPCITVRDETEWVETVETGWNVMTGADSQKILRAVRTFKPPVDHPPLYGDGGTAHRIVRTMTTARVG
ncbi:MAG: UDP-N-acetylglucosamine 2-epimerase (non-hydrolyzing) [Candidatus Desulfacyla sp.]